MDEENKESEVEQKKEAPPESTALSTASADSGNLIDMETGKLNPAVATFNALKSTSSEEVITALQNKKTIEMATNDQDVGKRMNDNAKVLINNQLDTTENAAITKNEKSFWDRHKASVHMYGYPDDVPRPRWQTRLMKAGADFWFVMYFIIASVTVCPLSVFFDVFKAIFKKGWVSMIIAVLAYLVFAIGVPFLVKYAPSWLKTK